MPHNTASNQKINKNQIYTSPFCKISSTCPASISSFNVPDKCVGFETGLYTWIETYGMNVRNIKIFERRTLLAINEWS